MGRCSSVGLPPPSKALVMLTSSTIGCRCDAGPQDQSQRGHRIQLRLFERSRRFDLKGNGCIDTPSKYYAVDLVLRNAKLGFRQNEYNHLMENAIYNELRYRGYSVDVGVIGIRDYKDGKR